MGGDPRLPDLTYYNFLAFSLYNIEIYNSLPLNLSTTKLGT